MRVVWLCEEIGLEYRIEPLEMFSAAMKRPEYLAIHPLGKVPAIDDDGFVLWETAAILQHLDAKYNAGALCPPPETEAGARALQWLGYGENPLTVTMGQIVAHSGPLPDELKITALVESGREIAPSLVAIVERALGEGPWILGEAFSLADIMLGYGLSIAQYLEYVSGETPKAQAYCERAMARAAYQRAAAR